MKRVYGLCVFVKCVFVKRVCVCVFVKCVSVSMCSGFFSK